jgi:LmbE family N-acetylglucosaminyl deacetylase
MITNESALVVAHPDDEVLWASSILESVSQIIVCFGNPGKHGGDQLYLARKEIMRTHPFAGKLLFLDMPESESLGLGDWANAKLNDWGIQFKLGSNIGQRKEQNYRRNFYELRALLQPQLRKFQNVITHNPWGEYGHEEHVQIFQVIKSLRNEAGFVMWVPGYVSKKTTELMLTQDDILTKPVCFKVNQELASKIKDLYIRHKAWTWYNNYCWPEWEFFYQIKEQTKVVEEHCRTVNFIPSGYQEKTMLEKFLNRFYQALSNKK